VWVVMGLGVVGGGSVRVGEAGVAMRYGVLPALSAMPRFAAATPGRRLVLVRVGTCCAVQAFDVPSLTAARLGEGLVKASHSFCARCCTPSSNHW